MILLNTHLALTRRVANERKGERSDATVNHSSSSLRMAISKPTAIVAVAPIMLTAGIVWFRLTNLSLF